MTTIVSIVEGDGEVAALPILLRRIAQWLSPMEYVHLTPPIRVRRAQFLNREDMFSKQLQLAALKCVEPGWILILLDADDDCPKNFAQEILQRAEKIIPHRRISVVLANREYEAWFIASALSLHGKRGFSANAPLPLDPESIRGAKEWLSERIPAGRYREVTDQPAFSSLIDLEQVEKTSRSFRKLCSEWSKQMRADALI